MDLKKAEKIYKKSLSVLKRVQLKNGGCLATPKGKRYPYIYPRDHGIIILGFISAGKLKEARKGLEFAFSAQMKDGAFPQRIDENGNNVSYKPIQLDATGCILYAAAEYVEKSMESGFVKEFEAKIDKAVNYTISNFQLDKNLLFTPNSIHEFPPTEEGLEIYANSVCGGAMKKISEQKMFNEKLRKKCAKSSQRIRIGINKHMWNSFYRSFIKNIRLNESSSVLVDADASSYATADFGLFKDEEKKVIETVYRIERELWHPKLGGLCRYPKYEGRNNGGWGPWPHFTLMICRHFIRTGNKEKANQYLDWILKMSYGNLLPEHISLREDFEEYVINFSEAGILRKDRELMINNIRKHPLFKKKQVAYVTIPLAWPHAEFIRTWNLYREKFQ